MAVPAHDTRDHEFAKKFNLPVRLVISHEEVATWDGESAYTGQGVLVNSFYSDNGIDWDGLPNDQAAKRVIDWLENRGFGKRQVILFNGYKLHLILAGLTANFYITFSIGFVVL
jgi:leucyl-tRNA synthetase